MTSNKIEGVELLRFLLSLGVVVFHFYFFGPMTGNIAASAGYIGLGYLSLCVEVFFAVSGFVIVMSAADRLPSDFAIARFSRLAPTLLVAATTTLLLYYALALPPRQKHAFLRYLVSIAVLPMTAVGGLDWSYWSLGIEVRFYLLIFVCMRFFNVANRAMQIAIALLLYDAACAVLWSVDPRLASHVSYLGLYAPFFAIGILAYDFYTRRRPTRVWILAALLAFALTVLRTRNEMVLTEAAFVRLSAIGLTQTFWAPVVMVTIFGVSLMRIGNAPLAWVCTVLGRTSYSLYATHQLCGYWILAFLSQRFFPGADLRIAVIIGLVLLTAAFGNFVEPAMIKAYSNALKGRRDWFATRGYRLRTG